VAKKYRDVVRLLRDNGWEHLRTRGSHQIWVHADGRRVVIPAGGKDSREVPRGTLSSIRRDTGIDEMR
jgi:predicted RNA binding protein YcfA (HicA-like mRNA interferase family)